MASADDRPSDTPPDHPGPETTRRRRRDLAQIDFEIEFFSQILERDPYFVDALKAYAEALAARGHLTRALQIDRRLVRLQPDRPIPWYNLACSYALLGLTDPAFFALERALDLGYRHIRHLTRDPDLRSLRRDPRLARLLRKATHPRSEPGPF